MSLAPELVANDVGFQAVEEMQEIEVTAWT
jgi:hypothetical protein